jgi:hypothetical protein
MVFDAMKINAPRGTDLPKTFLAGLFHSSLTWILAGFFIAYILFFYRPIFENPHHKMYFPAYVPSLSKVGGDLENLVTSSRKAVEGSANPYVQSTDFYYPPLTFVLFLGLSYIPFLWAFRVVSGCTIAFFFFSAFLFPLYSMRKRSVSRILLLVFALGLMSYGFQFEIERGQFNIIATGCALLAVLIYREAPRYRWIAFLLITIAIQMKIYPAIFILLFLEGRPPWRQLLRDLALLFLLNVASLFVLGVPRLLDFLNMVFLRMAQPYIWIGNMSATSFATKAYPANPSVLIAMIFGLYAVCLIGASWFFFTRPQKMARYYLFLVCVVGALIIPSVSHDYKLPLLIAPVVILLDSVTLFQKNQLLRIGRMACLLLCSAAFASTLFSFTNKIYIPGIGETPISILVQNNLPSLLVLLLGFAFLAMTQGPDPDPGPLPADNPASPV